MRMHGATNVNLFLDVRSQVFESLARPREPFGLVKQQHNVRSFVGVKQHKAVTCITVAAQFSLMLTGSP